MGNLPSLPVAVPFVVAAVIAAFTWWLRRRRWLSEMIALITAVAVTAICAVLLFRSSGGLVPYWFGGWTPRDGVAVGIAFNVEPFGAGMAAFTSLLVVAGLLFSARYFEHVRPLFHALMLVFLGAMAGFSLSGDLFNMFVFFELMSVAAYALTAFRVEQRGPLQGGLNFAVVNSIAGFLVLIGTGLLYGRTGALNLAQIGDALAGRGADGLVVVAFALVAGGFLVKAAMVPFHFWLADAYGVAPTPAGVVFAGGLSELGLLGVARLYWTAFEGVPGAEGIRTVLLILGAVTAVVGAVMAFEQRHMKRMLAFVTVAHSGMILVGIALLEPLGLGGAALYLIADGAAKGALFVCIGIVQHHAGNVDEDDIIGVCRPLRYTGVAFALTGLALAGLPPFGTALGKTLMEHAAEDHGASWTFWVFAFASIVTAAAVLRAAGRVFLGLGLREDEESPAEREADVEGRETRGARGRTPATMAVPAAVLLALALGVGLWPGLGSRAEEVAHAFQDREAYARTVLEGAAPAEPPPAPEEGPSIPVGISLAAGAAALAALALYRKRFVSAGVRGVVRGTVGRGLEGLRAIHSGDVEDYVAWLTLGVAALGGVLAVSMT
jgi:multicomponent Na+:H+ antiporter subunit D